MSNFSVWAFCAWIGILVAGLVALFIPVDPGEPFQPKPVAHPAPEPAMPALWALPPHVIERMRPLNAEDHVPVRPYTPEVTEAAPQHLVTFVGAVPARNPKERRAAAFAAAAGLPDPLHWMDDATDEHGVLSGTVA